MAVETSLSRDRRNSLSERSAWSRDQKRLLFMETPLRHQGNTASSTSDDRLRETSSRLSLGYRARHQRSFGFDEHPPTAPREPSSPDHLASYALARAIFRPIAFARYGGLRLCDLAVHGRLHPDETLAYRDTPCQRRRQSDLDYKTFRENNARGRHNGRLPVTLPDNA